MKSRRTNLHCLTVTPYQNNIWSLLLNPKMPLALVSTLAIVGLNPSPSWSQSGNQSDITGVNTIEIGTSTFQTPPPSTTETGTDEDTTEDTEEAEAEETVENTNPAVINQRAVEQILVSPATSPTTALAVQSQYITASTASVLQQLGVTLEGEEPSAAQIAAVLQQLFEATGNNAHYVQTTLTQDNQVVTTRLGPQSNQQGKAPHRQQGLGFADPDRPTLPWLARFNPASWGEWDSQLVPTLVKNTLKPDVLAQATSQDADELVSRYITGEVSGVALQQLVKIFKGQIQNPNLSTFDLRLSQKLYDTLIRPMEADLQTAGVDTLVVALDSQLRDIPLSALHDGQQFLGEKYSLTIVPSFGLTDIQYTDVRETTLLAMGASRFESQLPLPSVPVELDHILSGDFQGIALENQDFTLDNFMTVVRERQQAGEKIGVIHLATHGEFQSGDYDNSYIQFSDRRISLVEFRQIAVELGWDTVEQAPEILVLSACRTAVGDAAAELGFAGLAIASGAKTALASLWYVSDLGTLALMSEFYDALALNPLKSQALKTARQNLIGGETFVKDGQLYLASGKTLELPPRLARLPDQDFRHPFYWSAFTLIGNWN